jgi:hypothetical protein
LQEAVESITEETGAAVTVRGTYVPPNKETPEGEKKLFLYIDADSEVKVRLFVKCFIVCLIGVFIKYLLFIYLLVIYCFIDWYFKFKLIWYIIICLTLFRYIDWCLILLLICLYLFVNCFIVCLFGVL